MSQSYRFGEVEVWPAEREVVVGGKRADLGARAFDVLMAFIERRGRVVSKDELMRVVWPHAVVEENNLQAQISALRKALGAKAFATIPGRGYQLTLALSEEAPSSHAPARTNLPPPDGALVGRAPDVEAIEALSRVHRLVTLVGPGGIGKTRLAQEVMRRAVDENAHGAWWVDLASLAPSGRIAGTVSRALGASMGVAESDESLAASLRGRQLLVLLDNCGHVTEQVAATANVLLAAAPRVRILATSQRLLDAAAEHAYRVEPLSVPPRGSDLEAARGFGAIQLLEQRLGAFDPRLRLDERNVAGAIELCHALEGNALAIEMAAGRLPTLGFDRLLARLHERLQLLRRANDSDQRHRSLHAMLDWSHSLLEPREQTLLRRLAVFAGNFPLESAERAAAGAGTTFDATQAVAGLVAKSMLQVDAGETPRYRLAETTRLYAWEQLAANGESAAARAAHARAMATLAVEASRGYATAGRAWLERYLPDYANLQAAFQWAYEAEDASTGGTIAQALTHIDLLRNEFSAVKQRKAAAHALLPRASGRARGQLLNAITTFRLICIPAASRVPMARERVAVWRAIGDKLELFDALARFAGDLAVAGDFAAARSALEEARSLDDVAWPPRLRARLPNNERIVTMYRGDADAYAAQARGMLAAAERHGDVRAAVFARVLLAEATTMLGRYGEALGMLCRVRAENHVLDQPHTDAQIVLLVIGAHALAEELTRAAAAAREGLELLWRYGLSNWLNDYLALVAARVGLPQHAAQLLGAADAVYVDNQDTREPNEARAVREAEGSIARALGEDRAAALRVAGARLDREAAVRLATETIDEAGCAAPR